MPNLTSTLTLQVHHLIQSIKSLLIYLSVERGDAQQSELHLRSGVETVSPFGTPTAFDH